MPDATPLEPEPPEARPLLEVLPGDPVVLLFDPEVATVEIEDAPVDAGDPVPAEPATDVAPEATEDEPDELGTPVPEDAEVEPLAVFEEVEIDVELIEATDAPAVLLPMDVATVVPVVVEEPCAVVEP